MSYRIPSGYVLTILESDLTITEFFTQRRSVALERARRAENENCIGYNIFYNSTELIKNEKESI